MESQGSSASTMDYLDMTSEGFEMERKREVDNGGDDEAVKSKKQKTNGGGDDWMDDGDLLLKVVKTQNQEAASTSSSAADAKYTKSQKKAKSPKRKGVVEVNDEAENSKAKEDEGEDDDVMQAMLKSVKEEKTDNCKPGAVKRVLSESVVAGKLAMKKYEEEHPDMSGKDLKYDPLKVLKQGKTGSGGDGWVAGAGGAGDYNDEDDDDCESCVNDVYDYDSTDEYDHKHPPRQ